MNIILFVLLGAAAIWGIIWAYPKLPPPGGVILVIVVAIVAILVILSLAGIVPGGVSIG